MQKLLQKFNTEERTFLALNNNSIKNNSNVFFLFDEMKCNNLRFTL